jgi:hypothetical protein
VVVQLLHLTPEQREQSDSSATHHTPEQREQSGSSAPTSYTLTEGTKW